MNELITIIINVYNGEKFIKKCMDSVVNQTYKNLEIIIVNDGSTDNTLSICESYNDKRIRIISTENKGLSMSRNIGIDNALGEYLFFIDADDFMEIDTIEYLYQLITQNNGDISTCSTIEICDYNFKVKNKKETIKILDSKEMLKKILLLNDRFNAVWNKLIKKELFTGLRFENRIVNDVVVVYKLALKSNKIVYSNKVKYYYLRHSDSISIKKDPYRTIDLYKASIERYNYIENIYHNLKENKTSICMIIVELYIRKNEITNNFFENNKLFDIYKKMFSLKILFCKIKFKEKIRLILFRINPKLLLKISKLYKILK